MQIKFLKIFKILSDLKIKENFNLVSKNKTYSEEEIKEKLKIEFFGSYNLEKFNDLVKIDKQQLLKKIENINIYKNEYQLSEIFFSKDKVALDEKIKKIKKSIKKLVLITLLVYLVIVKVQMLGGILDGYLKKVCLKNY